MRAPGTSDTLSNGPVDTESRSSFPWLGVIAAVVVGLALRIPALGQDPWIDEIWSWGLAQSRARIVDILTIESSNSHTLTTLWMWLIGDQLTFVAYRLPSLVAGIASIALTARIAYRHGRSSALAAAWIVAVSFPAVVFATEARGYAAMVFCSLATFECAWTWFDTGRRRWLVATWIFALIGVLSQTLFVLGWAAIAIAVFVRALRSGRPRGIQRGLAFAGPPACAFVAWWFVNVRHVFNAGAPPWELKTVLGETLAWSVGLPLADWSLIVGGVIAAAIWIVDVRSLTARADQTWLAQVLLVVGVPLVTIALLWDEYLAARYFRVPLAFWSLSLARVLGQLAQSGRALRIVAVLLLALFAAGNGLQMAEFLRIGRSRVGELVHEMAVRTESRPIVVTGNYDFNVRAQIEWHKRTAPGGREYVYVSQADLTARGADFVLVNQPEFTAAIPEELRIGDHRYQRIATSSHAGPSGTDWALYKRADR